MTTHERVGTSNEYRYESAAGIKMRRRRTAPRRFALTSSSSRIIFRVVPARNKTNCEVAVDKIIKIYSTPT
jgi:hypothetical protein